MLLDLMGDVIPEQKWGISAAARDGGAGLPQERLAAAVHPRRRWIVNSIGRVTSRSVDLRLAILSQRWRSQAAGIAVVEEAAELVRRHLVP